jgi:hypothetical protein
MVDCTACGHSNPPGTLRCETCSAWLEPSRQGKPEPPTESDRGEQAAALVGEVLSLVRQGQKIAAIKHYREATGVGLKEAKDAVESIAQLHGIPQRSGCASAAVMALVLLVVSALAAASASAFL